MSTSPDDDFDPYPYKELKLMSHVSQKGLQAGSLLATILAVPILALRPSKTLSAGNVAAWALTGGAGGSALTTALCLAKMRTLEPDGIADRVYRLHFNEGQNRVDRFAQVGGVAGGLAMAAALMGHGQGAKVGLTVGKVLGGACVGVATGVVLHVATSALLEMWAARGRPGYTMV